MKERYSLKECVKVNLIKNIPSQAGLAGGSSDGAAMVKALNELFEINASDEELAEICLKIGADVPFCFYQKPAIVKGIGDKIERFAFEWDPYVLLVKPAMGISTKEAYQTLNIDKCDHVASDIIVEKLLKNETDDLDKHLKNSLEYSAFQLVPELKQLKMKIKDLGFKIVLMSGSGSTIFAISEDEQLIDQAIECFKQDETMFVCKTKFLK